MSTIMLVDDSATILLSLSSILCKAGYSVEKAPNAEEALEKFNADAKIDLLLTDLNMPGMDGLDLIREVRKLPDFKSIPTLFLTTESGGSQSGRHIRRNCQTGDGRGTSQHDQSFPSVKP